MNHIMGDKYQFKARTLERKFQRKMKKSNEFTTVNGKVNKVVGYTSQIVTITTKRYGHELSLSRKSLRKAISYCYFRRTAIRKDMEQFSKFSSALFGILLEVFKGKCRVEPGPKGLMRLILHSVRFYFSGLCRSPKDMKLIKSEGGDFVILSYYHLRSQRRGEQFLKYLKENNLKAIIDSGAYSVFEASENEKSKSASSIKLFDVETIPLISVREYAAFINRYKDSPHILGFFNLDVIGDPFQTKENFHILKSLTNVEVIQVWQVTDSYDELKMLVAQDPPLIAVGGCVPLLQSNQKDKVKSILNNVFSICKGVPIHGLGIANDLIHHFPFFSVDSLAWVNARKNGSRDLYMDSGNKIKASSDMTQDDILKQNIQYFAKLEFAYERPQLSLSF